MRRERNRSKNTRLPHLKKAFVKFNIFFGCQCYNHFGVNLASCQCGALPHSAKEAYEKRTREGTEMTSQKSYNRTATKDRQQSSTSSQTFRRLAIAASLLLPIFPMGGQVFAATPTTITLATDDNKSDFGAMWGGLIVTEAFKRMGVTVTYLNLPMARRTAMVDAAEADGDHGRVASYGATHPDLVRVDEPWTELAFHLYSAKKDQKQVTLEEIKAKDAAVEYRRGVLFCENKLKALKLSNLSDISNEQQGITKLAAGRIDYYCDVETTARRALNSPEFKDNKDIHQVLELGKIPIHVFLIKKHADLAPKLSAEIKKLRAEGMIETYRKQVEKQLGYVR